MTSLQPTLDSWIVRVMQRGWTWYAKYLSAHDTCAIASEQDAGPLLSPEVFRRAFPRLARRAGHEIDENVLLPVRIASHGLDQAVRLVSHTATQSVSRAIGHDEVLLTHWGGYDHPMVDESATGSLVLFAFSQLDSSEDAVGCEIWIASSPEEEDALLAIVGPLDPGAGALLAKV